MPLIWRVDDFPGTKPEEFWRHNLDNYRRFEELFVRRGLGLVLGVIPRYTTEADLRYFRESQTTTVALHGVYHDERHPNEFREHQTENEVYQAIQSARAPLDGCNASGRCDIYIPPHNVIDVKTVNALIRAGFSTLYGGPESDERVLNYARSKGMQVVRHCPPLYGRTDEMMAEGVHERLLRHVNRQQDVHVGLHFTWEWNIGLQSLETFLAAVEPVL